MQNKFKNYYEIFLCYKNKNNCINNEQLALAIAAKYHPEIFDIRIGVGTHLPLFSALG